MNYLYIQHNNTGEHNILKHSLFQDSYRETSSCIPIKPLSEISEEFLFIEGPVHTTHEDNVIVHQHEDYAHLKIIHNESDYENLENATYQAF